MHPGPPPHQYAAPYGAYDTPYAAAYGMSYGGVQRTNPFAIAALVLGILWLCFLGSVLGIVFGSIALRQINQRGERGRGLAIAGIVLGCIGLGLFVIEVIVGVAQRATTPTGLGSIGVHAAVLLHG